MHQEQCSGMVSKNRAGSQVSWNSSGQGRQRDSYMWNDCRRKRDGVTVLRGTGWPGDSVRDEQGMAEKTGKSPDLRPGSQAGVPGRSDSAEDLGRGHARFPEKHSQACGVGIWKWVKEGKERAKLGHRAPVGRGRSLNFISVQFNLFENVTLTIVWRLDCRSKETNFRSCCKMPGERSRQPGLRGREACPGERGVLA